MVHLPALGAATAYWRAFALVDPRYQIVAIGCLCPASIVLRSQIRKIHLHLVAIARPVVILIVQDQPQLEARIGAGQVHTVVPAKLHRLVVTRMLVAIEYRPNLIMFLE